ncbi:hypothetical protein EC844_11014 [Acinetobacter calcoaceticus]|uniref:Uncharacterized protein n=1 Tax=Acinetobacter calcoaceticus TaxID=471 RepID=A0A4R1Y4H3_ACICA|nr:hypothetical protein EC844_11014 [Acinetobacter calcoaceticus]
MSLIHKGGFRERANRNRRYDQSENRQSGLKPQSIYQPKTETSADLESAESHQSLNHDHLDLSAPENNQLNDADK